jgi:hypothetical protein
VKCPIAISLGLLASLAQAARPVVLENSGTFVTPDPGVEFFARHVAVDGDNAIALGEHFDGAPGNSAVHRSVNWFQRQSSGAWVFKRKLIDTYVTGNSVTPALAFKGGIAAAITDKLHVFELVSGNLVESVVDPAVANDVNGPELAIDAGRILGSNPAHCSWDGAQFTKSGAVWTVTTRYAGPSFTCVANQPGSSIALSGDYTLLAWPYANNQSQPLAGLFIYSNLLQSLGGGPRFGPSLALGGGITYHVSSRNTGIYAEADGAEGYVGWTLYTPLNASMGGLSSTVHVSAPYVFEQVWDYDRGAYVINVFGKYFEGYTITGHVATLVGPKGAALGTHFDVSGNRIIASGNNGYTGTNTAYVFDLPSSFNTLPVLQDDFQSGGAASWTPVAGNPFSVVALSRTTVYRQSDTAGNDGAVFGGSDRTVQGAQTDIRPLQFAAGDSWVGVMTRYQSETNYYFATLGAARVELRKILNGTNTLLATAPFAANAGKAYRLQLVSSGNLHQVFVDGVKLLQVYNNGLTHGRSGIRTNKASADFDNFVVTGADHATIYRTDFNGSDAGELGSGNDYALGTWELGTVRPGQYSQRSLANDRLDVASLYPGSDDQVVSARITLDAYGTPASGQQSWFGLVVRLNNGENYYALAILPGNQLQLRRVTTVGNPYPSKTTRVLATATTASGQHEYRLEAIGDRLRVYVDGNPIREARDSAFPTGNVALATNATQASFDDFQAYRP